MEYVLLLLSIKPNNAKFLVVIRTLIWTREHTKKHHKKRIYTLVVDRATYQRVSTRVTTPPPSLIQKYR